jgi:hypothetical protein
MSPTCGPHRGSSRGFIAQQAKKLNDFKVSGGHRIRYYGLLATAKRAENLARARELLMPPIIPVDAIKAINAHPAEPEKPTHSCPCCGGRMIIIERFQRGTTPHYRPSPPTPAIRIDTS